MAKGRFKKWATARVSEPIGLGKAGLEVIIWDKWGKKRRGKAIVSVGGLRWYPYKAKRPHRLSWDQLDQIMTGG